MSKQIICPHDETYVHKFKTHRRCLYGSVLSLFLFISAFVIVPALISEVSATDATTDVTWKSLSLTLDPDYGNGSTSDLGHGDVDFGEIVPTGANDAGNVGTMKVAKKTIGVFSAGNYYSVFLSMAGTSNSLTKTGDTTQNISAVSGTWSSPAAFSGTGWGYAVPTKTITSGWTTPFDSAQAGTYSSYNSFLVDPSDPDANNLTKQGTGSSVYNTGTWAAIPTSSQTAQQIWKNSTSNAIGFEDGDFFDVYYAVMADIDIMAGTYSNEIVYTALASSSALDKASTNISRDIEFVTSGTTETLEIDLATVPATALTDDDVTVAVVPHATIASANYSPTGLTIGNYDKCAVQSIVSANKGATITCTMPTIGTGNIQIADSTTTANGEYDFWVQVNKYGQTMNYISKYTASGSNVATVVYAGLQSKNTSGKFYITEMQDMTANICKNTNIWSTAYGADARVYAGNDTAFSGSPKANTAAGSAAIGVGTFVLGDNRETITHPSGTAGYSLYGSTGYKTYLIRRLADGNCWMVQNLDLNLADFTSSKSKRLTSENTNLTAGRTWIPDAALANRTWSTNATKIGGYDNTLGTTGILEPSPTGGISNLSISTYQFQSRNNFGPNFYWGSRYQSGTTTDNTSTQVANANNGDLRIANNANSSYARSYNNDYAYITGDHRVNNQTTCLAANNDGCRMPGAFGNQGGTLASVTSSDGTTQDTAWQPDYIENSTSDNTYTMRGTKYIGDYYNWYAATAESGQFSTVNTSVSESICPKGWKLPRNEKSASVGGSWSYLLGNSVYKYSDANGGSQQAAIVKMMQLPLSIPFTGSYEWTNGALNGRGYDGNFWASTATGSSAYAYNLYFYYNGNVYPQNSSNKVNGFTVRCVAE